MSDSIIIDGLDLTLLGVTMLRDSTMDILPARKDRTVKVLGRDGEYFIPGKISDRLIELHLHIEADSEEELLERQEQLRRIFTGDLELALPDNPDRVYYVRYAGQTDLTQWIQDSRVTIPLRMYDPYIYSRHLSEYTGNGTLYNRGSESTPLTIEITGPASAIDITVGSQELYYSGSLAGGEKLVIDGKNLLVSVGSMNALPNLSGDIPLLPPGPHFVSCSSGSAKWTWRERWIV